MPISVSTGTATSNIDLLQKLVTWLGTRGWTNNMSQADGSGWRAHLSKSGVYVNLRASVGNDATWRDNFSGSGNYNYALHLFLGTGYSSGSAFNAQPGGPTQSGTSYTVGVAAVAGSGALTSYQFIDDGADNILVAIERTPGVWRHLCWGTMVKLGSWTGGTYFGGSSAGYYGSTTADTGGAQSLCPFSCNEGHTGFVRVDVDAFTSKWVSFGSSTTAAAGYTGKLATSGVQFGSNQPPSSEAPKLSVYAQAALHNSLGSRAVTLPVMLFVARDAGGYSALGELPSLRLCRATDLAGMSPGADFSQGAETWRVFPGYAVRVA
jgi:hypothetical protein